MQSRNASTNVARAKAIVRKNNARLFAYASTTAFFALVLFAVIKLA